MIDAVFGIKVRMSDLCINRKSADCWTPIIVAIALSVHL